MQEYPGSVNENGHVRYKHLIWDMGGTLFDTYPATDRILADTVRDAGGQVEPGEVEGLTRQSTSVAVTRLAERYPVTEEQLRAAIVALKRRWLDDPPEVMAGAEDLIDRVRASGGLNVVITHRERDSAASLLETRGIFVDDMICAPDGYPRKPDPSMYRLMLERHHLRREECLAIGDRPIDAQAANAVGVDAALIWSAATETFHAPQTRLIHSLGDLRLAVE